ncbi:sterol carrier protein [Candidatus Geothermarchaeota archaeon ex4572_27]|nr:MAG: sterol carrier protein [Candidatus Geothermarchaeota archaeon ex4572_27]
MTDIDVKRVRDVMSKVYEKAKAKLGPELKSWNKVFQFEIEGGEPFYVHISGESVRVEAGRHPSPLATLTMNRDILSKILRGELDPITAFLRGLAKISGNILEAANIRRLFEAAKE